MGLVASLGAWTIRQVREMGGMFLLALRSFRWLLPPRFDLILQQMERVGVRSTPVILMTGAFTGMVFALETFYAMRKFGAETMVGVTVALGMTRELGPVFTSIMITARAGSAMAAELGTMRITEQIDALEAMAVNPVSFLVVPRLVATTVMVPLLTVISDFIGIVGGYFVGVILLRINAGAFVANIEKYTGLDDLYYGLIKATVFGFVLALICCYKGYTVRGGAEGVGRATTESVVMSAVAILMADYILTSLLF